MSKSNSIIRKSFTQPIIMLLTIHPLKFKKKKEIFLKANGSPFVMSVKIISVKLRVYQYLTSALGLHKRFFILKARVWRQAV